MLTVSSPVVTVNENRQAEILKNIVPDPGWFDSDQMKFKD